MFFKCYYELAKSNSQDKGCFYDIGYQCECSSTLWNYYKQSNKLSSKCASKLCIEMYKSAYSNFKAGSKNHIKLYLNTV